VRNHSKFISIDHRFLLVTSANFSWSAENANLELGMLVDNRNLAEAVELQMREAEAYLFERVTSSR
jgi:phosphatidylserine/phosphatidylglycerophosphate/cardiolipin synthase-like enzyme